VKVEKALFAIGQKLTGKQAGWQEQFHLRDRQRGVLDPSVYQHQSECASYVSPPRLAGD
jgi:hypothetical protein